MLPSQSARPSSSRAHMYRRTRHKRGPLVIGLLTILVGVFAVFKWWPGADGVSSAEGAGEPALPQPQAPADPKPDLGAAKAVPVEPAPVKAPPPPTLAPKSETFSMAGNPGAGNRAGSPTNASQDSRKENPKPEPPKAQPPAQTPPPPPAPSNPDTKAAEGSKSEPNSRVSQRVKAGFDLIAQNKPLEARKALTTALTSSGISPAESERVRTELAKVNQRLVFSPEIVAGDPFVSAYKMESGDAIAKLPKKLGLDVDWRLIQRINGLSSPEKVQAGQKLKMITGPFHAIIHKSAYRMDLYLGDGSERVYVRSFRVGLGEYNATPEGVFTVKSNSKLINPFWANPRTGESYEPNDPKNPIGEHWIGLVGLSDNIRDLEGYGIHGTIDPDSIGQQKSMGCVRMAADDVALVWELLIDNVSRVEIHGEDYP